MQLVNLSQILALVMFRIRVRDKVIDYRKGKKVIWWGIIGGLSLGDYIWGIIVVVQ